MPQRQGASIVATVMSNHPGDGKMSHSAKLFALMGLPMLLIAGCTQLNAEDRALLDSTRQAAVDAKTAADRAAEAANRAASASTQSADASKSAAAAAQAAANDAKAASERADRMFQRTQRKVSQ
jgi:hypothetical protein